MLSSLGRIYLIGLMGAGKTTVGKILAAQMNWIFVDLDHKIEVLAGKDIPRIFAEEKEAAFRQYETQVLRETVALDGAVIACGGGVVTRKENVSFLNQEFVIWLDLQSEVAAARLEYSDHRPLLGECKETLTELNEILSDRRDAYTKAATIRVNSGGNSPDVITSNILRELEFLND